MKRKYKIFTAFTCAVVLFLGIFSTILMKKAAAAVAVTWDPNNKGSVYTLTNNNLTAIAVDTGGGVRATEYKTSGKYYWEITLEGSNGDLAMLGIANELFSVTSNFFTDANQLSWYGLGSSIYPQKTAYGTGFKQGDTVGIALDIDNHKINYYLNGADQGVVNIPSWNKYYAFFTCGGSLGTGKVTANFGKTSFKYTVPTGYNSYDTSGYAASIVLDNSNLALTTGQSTTLNTTITPSDAVNKTLTWVSNNPAIATVDSTGKVTAVAPGTATITATTQDGSNLSASCVVTVTNPAVNVTNISVAPTSLSLSVGQSNTVTATVLPDNATNKNVTWSSSDNTIATVDGTGKVTAVKEGSVTITATTEDGGKTATCIVTVSTSNRALLTITMTNNERKEFDLPMAEVDKFVAWYNDKTSASYKIDKAYNVKPFNSRTEYIAHDAVSSFEVNQYAATSN